MTELPQDLIDKLNTTLREEGWWCQDCDFDGPPCSVCRRFYKMTNYATLSALVDHFRSQGATHVDLDGLRGVKAGRVLNPESDFVVVDYDRPDPRDPFYNDIDTIDMTDPERPDFWTIEPTEPS